MQSEMDEKNQKMKMMMMMVFLDGKK